MGLFESVAGTIFNTATAAYQTVARPIVSAASTVYQTATRPITSGSVSTGQTQQVAVQPKPPIVTAVAPSQAAATAYQQAGARADRTVTTTPQVTPSGRTVYVTSRASPVIPEPVIISRPVSIQAPSAAQAIGMLAPGGALVGAAKVLSADENILQNVVMDVTGLRQQQIQSQQAALQQRSTQLQAQATALQQKSQMQRAQIEQQALGFEQKKQDILARKQRFEALGPATSIEEYNTRLGEYNLLNQDIAGLNTESARINEAGIAARREGLLGQIGLLNERDRLRTEGVNLNVDAANVGTTGLAGLTTGFDLRVNKPISDIALTKIGEPFGLSKEDVALGLQLNRQVSEGMVTFGGPSIQNLAAAYGAGMITDTLMKPGEAIFWTGVGIATGGVTRALAPGMEAAVAASRVTGASFGTRALGAGIQAAPIVMGGLFAGSVGLDVASQKTPGAMVSRFGGLTATEILPMVGGAVIGYNAPEIWRGIQTRNLPIGFKTEFVPTDEPPFKRPSRGTPQEYRLREIGAELRSIPFREPTFPTTGVTERPIGGKQPRIERVSPTQEEFLQLSYEPFETIGREIKPAVGLTREQLLPVPVRTEVSFVDLTKPVRSVPIASQRLTPVYEMVTGKPGKYALRGYQAKINPLEGDPLGLLYEDIPSSKVFEFNPQKGAFEPQITGRAWYKSITEYGLPKADIFMQPAVEPLGTGKVFGPQRPAKVPVGKQFETFLGRPSEQMQAYDTFAGWKGGMETALGGGGGKVKVGGGGLILTERPKAVAESTRIVGTYPRVSTEGTVGIGIPSFSQTEKNIMAAVGSMAFWGRVGPQREMGVRGIGSDAYGRFMRQIKFEDYYGVGRYPETMAAFGAAEDERGLRRSFPNFEVRRPTETYYRDIGDYLGTRPEITTIPAIGQLPTSLVGTIIEPRLDITPITMSIVEPAQIPAITQVPITTTIQVPDLRMDQQLINQQILITEMNVPPYTPPTYDFIIPEIPVPVIPGFPMGGGGGGGGGGFGLGQGGYLFEETWAAGGNQDPFGIGGMNFDAASLVGIGSGKRSKRKRRR